VLALDTIIDFVVKLIRLIKRYSIPTDTCLAYLTYDSISICPGVQIHQHLYETWTNMNIKTDIRLAFSCDMSKLYHPQRQYLRKIKQS